MKKTGIYVCPWCGVEASKDEKHHCKGIRAGWIVLGFFLFIILVVVISWFAIPAP